MRRRLLALAAACMALCAIHGARSDQPQGDFAGTSPGERAAIEELCGGERSAMARQMCISNQIVGLRRARKPDLSVASPDQRAAIERWCASQIIPSDRFACQRRRLAAFGLPVRNEPGAGILGGDTVASGQAMLRPTTTLPRSLIGPTGFPSFSLKAWRHQRPRMPAEHAGPAMGTQALYNYIAPSVYVVVASDQPVELAERAGHAQGSAVAVTDSILLTNCHVVAGRPQIRLSQEGHSGRAIVVYADPGGDRCFLKSLDMTVHPVHGVRRFETLHVGEPVFSLGTPQGLELSFGQGLVSGLRYSEGVRLVQNSAPSWHGSSGGGLFDARGNLVGITTMGSTTVANLNFSIAAEDFWP